jgi:aminopeptidase N
MTSMMRTPLRQSAPRSGLVAVFAGLVSLAVLSAGLPAQGAVVSGTRSSTSVPSPGSRGLGDRLYPSLGNGGYDAQHYDLDLRYATSAPSQGIDGTMTMTAVATQALSRFDLDFRGTGLGSVSVDGTPAAFRRSGGELVITPAQPIRDGATFVVTVRHFTSEPTVANEDKVSTTVFFQTAEGSAVAGQPNLMNVVYPSNDYPTDKATFSFRMDVPAGETAVANGVLTGRHTNAGRTVWTYQERQPMATELTQLVVGRYSIINRGTVDGVQVRDVVPTDLRAFYDKKLAIETSQLRWMIARAGKYPFPLYGTLVVTADIGFALETQTLSLFDTTWWTETSRGEWAPSMTHELAHQWYGDSVSPATWSDIWLNEGHATWYEANWAAQRGFLADDTGFTVTSLAGFMRQVYALGDRYRAEDGPVALPLDRSKQFSDNVYFGGALVLYALRQQVGAAAFEKLERGWAQQNAGTARTTDDFIAFASASTGQDLGGFLRAWLYGTTTPPMPGHPDWTVEPPK